MTLNITTRDLERCWRNVGMNDQACAWARWNAEQLLLWRSTNAVIRWRKA
jgi:hypothetical protein